MQLHTKTTTLIAAGGVFALVAVAASTVGSGAPNATVAQTFADAYNRGSFSTLVTTVLNDVHLLIPSTATVPQVALVQEYQAKGAGAGVKYAIVNPNPAPATGASVAWQVFSDIYSYYNTVTPAVAGLPTMDTAGCPSSSALVCDYQTFSNDYALFVYSKPSSASYTVSDPFFTAWNGSGGATGPLGLVTAAPASVTSASTTAGSAQTFTGGAVYAYPPSAVNAPAYAVSGGIYSAFTVAGGPGVLGFPTSQQILLGNGQRRQTFELGAIVQTGDASAIVQRAIAQLYVGNYTNGLQINQGSTATLNAVTLDTLGYIVTGRALSWTSSNGNVATVQGNGNTATVTAVGPGSASIYVSGEGKTGPPLSVIVTAPCCAVGDGAPAASISQAFQAAASRNHLSFVLPNPTPVASSGGGYAQVLTTTGGTTWAITLAPGASVAYAIGGPLYAAFLANGGVSGALGFPGADASAGGTQTFSGGAALAGSPVQVLPVPIAARWLATGAETGALGVPTGAAAEYRSLNGVSGRMQAFAGGEIVAVGPGAYLMNGPILARYFALNGPAGSLGVPVGEAQISNGVASQYFENGYIDLQPGASAAVEHLNTRKPAVSATPSNVAPGGKVHISASGFAPGATLAFALTGQPGFSVAAPGGSFAWDIVIPASAPAGVVSVQASAGTDSALATYTVAVTAQLRPTLTVVSGDQQTGAPGSLAAVPLVAVLTDSNGNPMPGVSVTYTASPGASATVPVVTDSNGRIQAGFRLPSSTGLALLSVYAGGQQATFRALASPSALAAFPAVTALDPRGTLVASLAGVIQYYQNAGAMGTPNGLATTAALNQFLTVHDGFAVSETGASVANPWVATEFAGLAGSVSVENATLDQVRDVLNTGTPVILLLNVQIDGVVAGSAAVDAIGVNGDGSILISDPSAFGRVSLADYLGGFSALGHSVQGSLAGGLRLVPGSAMPVGFVVAAPVNSGLSVASAGTACSVSLDVADPQQAGSAAPATLGGVRFAACDGTASAYQAAFAKQTGAAVSDLTGSSAAPISAASGNAFQVARVAGRLVVAPQAASIATVVNAAGFGAGLSPGAFFTVFGTGLAGTGSSLPTVTVGGRAATVIAAFPFQVNALMPTTAPVGSTAVQVTSSAGTASANVTVAGAGPGVFVIGTAPNGQPLGAVVNGEGTVSGATSPSLRGQYISIYGTGLGATVTQGGFQVAAAPVTVLLNGSSLKPSYAGLTPGIAGLYQVNVLIPAGTVPGVASLTVQVGSAVSNAVAVVVQ